MALHVVNKPLHAAVKRNPYQSGCDFWAVLWPYTAGSGTTLTNLGYRPSHDGTLSAATWAGTDGGDGTLAGNMHAGNVTTKGPSPAVVRDYPRGAMLLWVACDGTTLSNRTAMITGGTSAGTGNAPGTAGNLYGMRVNFEGIGISGARLAYRKADDTEVSLAADCSATANVPYPILVQWGERGLSIRTPHGYAEDTSITTGMRLKSGGMIRLNSAVNADTVQALPYHGFGWADRQLDDWEARDFLTDPALPMRDDFRNGTEYWTYNTVNPCPGRETPTTVDFQWAGPRLADTMPATSARVRILWSTDEYMQNATATAARVITTADKERPIIVTATGLPEDSRIYWVAQSSTDGGTLWYNFAGGRGTLRDQKTTAGRFTWAKVADDHSGIITSATFGLDDAKWLSLDIQDISATGVDSIRRINRGLADLRKQVDIHDIAFILHMGDGPWNNYLGQAWYKIMSVLFKCGTVKFALGNHEAEGGPNQSVTDAEGATRPRQRESAIRRLAKLPNPTKTTYPTLGGADDPLPVEPSAVAAYVSNVDWIPNIAVDGKVTDAADGVAKASGASNPADYFDKFIYETGVVGTHAQKLAYLADGLQNYYAFAWGDSLFIVLDEYRYSGFTETGGALDNSVATYHDDERPDTDYHREIEPTYGPRQRAHIERWLALPGYRHKEVISHTKMGPYTLSAGSLKPYRRGAASTVASLSLEGRWLAAEMEESGAARHWSGHDHGYAIASPADSTVNYITCPTFGAPLRFTATMVGSVDYGDPGLNGADQAGIDAHVSQYGYLLCTNDIGGRFSVWMRQTCVDRNDLRFNYDAQTLIGRWVGDEYLVSSGRIYLSERPDAISIVCDQDAGDYATHGQSMPINLTSGFDSRLAYATDADTINMEGVLSTGLADTDTVTIQAVDDGGEDNLTSGDYAVATHTDAIINLESAAASAASVGYGRMWYRGENKIIGQAQDWTRESPAMLRADAVAGLDLQVWPLAWMQPFGVAELAIDTALNGTRVLVHYAPRVVGRTYWPPLPVETDSTFVNVGADEDVVITLNYRKSYRIYPGAVGVFYSTDGTAVDADFSQGVGKGYVPTYTAGRRPVTISGVSELRLKTAAGSSNVTVLTVTA